MGLFKKNDLDREINNLVKKVNLLIDTIYAETPEINNLLYREILCRKKNYIPSNSGVCNDQKNIDKAKALGYKNYYYLIGKGPLMEIYDFLVKEKIDEFFIVKVNTNEVRTVFKSDSVGNYLNKGSCVFVRKTHNNVDVEKDVIKRFSYRVNNYIDLNLDEFKELMLDKDKKLSLDSLLDSKKYISEDI